MQPLRDGQSLYRLGPGSLDPRPFGGGHALLVTPGVAEHDVVDGDSRPFDQLDTAVGEDLKKPGRVSARPTIVRTALVIVATVFDDTTEFGDIRAQAGRPPC